MGPLIFKILACLLLLVLLVILLAASDGRKTLIKLRYQIGSFFVLDVGKGGTGRLLLISLGPALIPALGKAFHEDGKGFDVRTFLIYFGITFIILFVFNIATLSMKLNNLLSPGAGRVFRVDRKIQTSAVIKRINRALGIGNFQPAEVNAVLTDLLDIIVSHTRDHRGHYNEKRHAVFANILIEDGQDLVVIARDRNCHNPKYLRETPKRYPKGDLLCSSVIRYGRPLSVGMLNWEFPNGPQNKPYKSIIGIPLIGPNQTTYGALSIDSTRPYFFSSLDGEAENNLENSLQPYIQLIILVLERMVSGDAPTIISRLTSGSLPVGGSNV